MFKILFTLLIVSFAIANGKLAKKKVCIVGAGLSGLVNAKFFSDYPKEFEVVVFEKNSDVGGLWIYTDSTTVDEHGLPVHSSVYKNLRTNGVKTIMTFPEYPAFGDESTDGRFIKHELVLGYLRNYTNHFNLRQFVKFNTNVEKIRPLPHNKWLIVSRNLDYNKIILTTCDAVAICNGHNFKGYVPKIEGIDKFTGKVLHSHIYRKPEIFANQTVVLLGASESGRDIALDVSSVARKVYLSHRGANLPGKYPSNLEQVPGVIGAERDKLILSNGTKIRADALLLCTGYDYYYPFLDKSTGIFVEAGKHIHSIYKHLINVQHPTMAFFDLANTGFHFQLVHVQANYFRAVLRGKLRLPSREEMLKAAEKDLSNIAPNKGHISTSIDEFLKYYDDIAVEAGGNRLPWWVYTYLDQLIKLDQTDPVHTRDKKLIVHENNRTIEFV